MTEEFDDDVARIVDLAILRAQRPIVTKEDKFFDYIPEYTISNGQIIYDMQDMDIDPMCPDSMRLITAIRVKIELPAFKKFIADCKDFNITPNHAGLVKRSLIYTHIASMISLKLPKAVSIFKINGSLTNEAIGKHESRNIGVGECAITVHQYFEDPKPSFFSTAAKSVTLGFIKPEAYRKMHNGMFTDLKKSKILIEYQNKDHYIYLTLPDFLKWALHSM